MSDPTRLDDATLPALLLQLGLVTAGERIAVEPAGDGNINWVRRVRAGERSFVVKQARPALERFPEYQAPTERIVCEARYYEAVRALDADRVCPEVLCFDEANRVLVLEDVAAAQRLDDALAAGIDVSRAAERLAGFLGRVHAATRDDPTLAARFANDGMRRLHGDHIFDLPFRENEFPLPPRVRARAEWIWREGRVAAVARDAYARYLAPEGALVHADVQSTNVLLAGARVALLDAEIAHAGDAAFDLGTLFAHLWLPAVARGAPAAAERAVDAAQRVYRAEHRAFGPADVARARRYAAIEMLRRTIGAARVAAVADEAASLRVIDFATALV